MTNLFFFIKNIFLITLIFCFVQTSFSQEDGNVAKFSQDLLRYFDPLASHANDSALFTESLLVIKINKNHKCDSVYFSDSAPDWQQKRIKKSC